MKIICHVKTERNAVIKVSVKRESILECESVIDNFFKQAGYESRDLYPIISLEIRS